jgi:hypothetical protein
MRKRPGVAIEAIEARAIEARNKFEDTASDAPDAPIGEAVARRASLSIPTAPASPLPYPISIGFDRQLTN